MDWFSGPLTQVWGIPAFWVTRLAKVVQLLSGMVIILEIIGPQRIQERKDMVQRRLSKMMEVHLPMQVVSDMAEMSMYLLSLLSQRSSTSGETSEEYPKPPEQNRFFWPGFLISLVFGLLLLVQLIIAEAAEEQPDLDLTLCLGIPTCFILGMIGAFAFLLTLSFLTYVVLRAIKATVDLLANILIRMLQKTNLMRLSLCLSLCLIIVGFFLEILVS
jgi:hypothetical protein